MGSSTYRPRVVDAQIKEDLEALGAVLVEGPRACGKTSSAATQASSAVYLDAEPGRREAARLDPSLVLDGPTPRLLDEWQLVPELWNAVRREVDARGGPGHFLLTGSAMPALDARRHSGAGRFAIVRMRPMTLWESGESTGDVSLAALLAGDRVRGRGMLTVPQYVEALVRGGWPELVGASPRRAQRFVQGYLDAVVERDVPLLEGSRRDPVRLRRFLTSYAQHSSQTVSLSGLVSRAVGDDAPRTGRSDTLTWHTADAYADAASRLMVVEDVPAWSPRLRSRTRLGALPKRVFTDPSLAAGLLGAGPSRLLAELTTLGALFESLVTRDLRVYAQSLDASVYHYRERSGDLEVDLILETRDGGWLGVEVKLGSHQIDAAAAALRRVAERRVERPPAGLVVITAGEYAYTREDGVSVVPLAALRP